MTKDEILKLADRCEKLRAGVSMQNISLKIAECFGVDVDPSYLYSIDVATQLIPESAFMRSGHDEKEIGSFFCEIITREGKYFKSVAANEALARCAAALRAKAGEL